MFFLSVLLMSQNSKPANPSGLDYIEIPTPQALTQLANNFHLQLCDKILMYETQTYKA